MLERYIGVIKPEEKEVFTRFDSKSVINNAFELWILFLKQSKLEHDEAANSLLDEACRLLKPYEKALPFVIAEESFFTSLTNTYKFTKERIFSGIFYTALLNMGTTERKVFFPLQKGMDWCGYKLQKGTLSITSIDSWWTGLDAEGGCIIDNGSPKFFGCAAKDGVFIKHRYALKDEEKYSSFGYNAHGGIFINHGYTPSIGDFAHGGLFINYDSTLSGGEQAEGDCIFVSPTMRERCKRGCIYLIASDLKKDKSLSLLIDKMYEHTKDSAAIDIPAIKNLGDLIKIYCEERYGDR